MSLSTNKTRLLLVGTYPPPYGGISVYIKRLHALLNSSEDFSSYVLDINLSNYTIPQVDNVTKLKGNTFLKIIKWILSVICYDFDLVHFHVSALGIFKYSYFVLPFIKNKKKIVTIHSGNFVDYYKSQHNVIRYIYRLLFSEFDHIITVNQNQKSFIQKEFNIRNEISVIPAFLPPTIENISQNIISEMRLFNNRHEKVFLTSGFMFDYYGFHIIIESIIKLNMNNNFNVGLIIACYTSEEESFKKLITDYVNKYKFIKLYENLTPDEFACVMKMSDVYVRATDRDGDAVSVREAIYFKKKVVASDCVKRPEGVITFETMNTDSLLAALLEVVKFNNDSIVEASSLNDNQYTKERLLFFYNDILFD